MENCWATDPDDRPTANELHICLSKWNPDISATNHFCMSASTNMATMEERQEMQGSAFLEAATPPEDPSVQL